MNFKFGGVDHPASVKRKLITGAAGLVFCFGALFLVCVFYSFKTACINENLVRNAMRNEMLGLFNYRNARGSFPPIATRNREGLPLYSWRLSLINWIDASPRYSWPEAQWSDPKMKEFSTWPCPVYCFSEDSNVTPSQDTRILAVTGLDSAFPDIPVSGSPSKLPGNLIVLVEVFNSGIHWMQPEDLVVADDSVLLRGAPFVIQIPEQCRGFHVAFADGEVWFISKSVPLDRVTPLMTAMSATRAGREELLAEYRLQ